MATPSAAHPHPANAVATLLTRYLAGQIAEAQFASVSDLLDDTEASADERIALARFYLDALAADPDVNLPRTDELSDFLRIARA